MPEMTLPWDSAGLIVSVGAGLPFAVMQQLQQANVAFPPPVEVRGLLDTGSDISLITPTIVQHFGLPPFVTRTSQTTGGSHSAGLYSVSLILMGPQGLTGSTLVSPDHVVMGCLGTLPDDLDVIIGLDILRTVVLLSDGPNQQFTLRW